MSGLVTKGGERICRNAAEWKADWRRKKSARNVRRLANAAGAAATSVRGCTSEYLWGRLWLFQTA